MRHLVASLCLCILVLPVASLAETFRFSVLMRIMEDQHDDQAMRNALDSVQTTEPAFIIINGLKRTGERCSEALYQRRKQLLAQSSVPVILSMAASDWALCQDRKRQPAGLVWLNLLREQYAGNLSTHSASMLNIKHQSTMRAYRNYSENARWVVDRVLFATLHVAAYNNHYIEAAGRNQEFEDRQVANREWIRRLGEVAVRERRGAIVIFCDGNPWPALAGRPGVRDGYREVRQQLQAMAEKSGVRVLLVQGAPADAARTTPEIVWHDRLGYVSLPAGVSTLSADLDAPLPFSVILEAP